MSDDKAITEQTTVDEETAFNDESEIKSVEDEGLEDITEKDDKKPDEKKPVDENPEKEEVKKEGLEDKPEEEIEEEVDEEEEDEDIKRGKELLENENKIKTEQEAKEREVAAKKANDGYVSPRERKLNKDNIAFYKNVIPKNFLPDTVTLDDGTILDFKNATESMPELPVMAAAIAHNIISQMTHDGILMTSNDIKQVTSSVDSKLYYHSLTNSFDGVPKAQDIVGSEDFKKWFQGQKEEIKALSRSSDYRDHVKIIKRFMNDSGIKQADKKIAEIDEKRKEKKKQFDSIHKTTVKSSGKPKSKSVTPQEEEMEGFTSKGDDDDFYLR